ncbi:MAG: folate family ECF transporter S component [Clostridiales bacterium]|nr:folate family ECF transporter S component [Clostridiales bacterium]MDD7034614.1 folate family ECF transporter S component [Bacillota bacterium]MDY2919757.1 folate family ECF transporter S component [Lentihominibacter sp.]
MQQNTKTQRLVIMAILITISVILTRFCSINTPILRIGFGFVPCAIMGIMYGPLWAAAGYAIADVLGMLIFPTGTFFPGFTVTAFLTGIVYGLFYHNRPVTIKSSLLPNLLVSGVLNLILDTVWLMILMGQGFWALLPTRILKCVVMFVIQVVLIPVIWNKVVIRIPGISLKTA